MDNNKPLPIWLYYQHEMEKTWEEVKAKLNYLDTLALNFGRPDVDDDEELNYFRTHIQDFKEFGDVYFKEF